MLKIYLDRDRLMKDFDSNSQGCYVYYEWHIGEPCPVPYEMYEYSRIKYVEYIEANNHELSWIISLGIISPPKENHISLYGDLARTVVLNMLY